MQVSAPLFSETKGVYTTVGVLIDAGRDPFVSREIEFFPSLGIGALYKHNGNQAGGGMYYEASALASMKETIFNMAANAGLAFHLVTLQHSLSSPTHHIHSGIGIHLALRRHVSETIDLSVHTGLKLFFGNIDISPLARRWHGYLGIACSIPLEISKLKQNARLELSHPTQVKIEAKVGVLDSSSAKDQTPTEIPQLIGESAGKAKEVVSGHDQDQKQEVLKDDTEEVDTNTPNVFVIGDFTAFYVDLSNHSNEDHRRIIKKYLGSAVKELETGMRASKAFLWISSGSGGERAVGTLQSMGSSHFMNSVARFTPSGQHLLRELPEFFREAQSQKNNMPTRSREQYHVILADQTYKWLKRDEEYLEKTIANSARNPKDITFYVTVPEILPAAPQVLAGCQVTSIK